MSATFERCFDPLAQITGRQFFAIAEYWIKATVDSPAAEQVEFSQRVRNPVAFERAVQPLGEGGVLARIAYECSIAERFGHYPMPRLSQRLTSVISTHRT